MPPGQGLHASAPDKFAKVPTPHGVAAVEPTAHALPGEHAVQSASAASPAEAPYFPAGHRDEGPQLVRLDPAPLAVREPYVVPGAARI